MQGYEPKADPRLQGTFRYLAVVCAVGAPGKLLLDLLWVPSSPADLVVYWCALGLFGLCGERIAARMYPTLAARFREGPSQRAIW